MNDWACLRAFKQVPIEFYGRRLIMHARKARPLLAGAFVHGHRASETNLGCNVSTSTIKAWYPLLK